MNKNQIIPSVNFHLWEPCNMRCKFCFATFQDVKQSILPAGHLSKEMTIQVVKELASFGFEKITFAGGEPTLCPWLHDLIKTAKQFGMTTMIVTNGSKLNDEFLIKNQPYLDWIAISVDSLITETNLTMGRAIAGKKTLSLNNYKTIVEKIKHFGFGLKINSVVNSKNFNENMIEFIQFAKPKRWKILQTLPIIGQNDQFIDDFKISETEFLHFVNHHSELKNFTNIVTETNEQIKGSYAMVDPAGRFFDDFNGVHKYSNPILEVGVENAIKEVVIDAEKFNLRGGNYDWK